MVSAIIVSWKRPNEVAQIVENLHQYEFIDEIKIEINRPDNNTMCSRRWEAALRAKNDTIFFQDDDCIIENVRELYEQYDGTRMVIGLKGTRILEYDGELSAMVGWGTFLDKSWIDVKKYIDKYGIDDLFIRELDRIFTYEIGQKRPHNYQIAKVNDFESASGEMALWVQENHWDKKAEAIERAKELYG